MIDFILDHKWYFFIAGEVVFWGSLIGFLLLRYGLNQEKLSKYSIVIWLISDLWLLTIGVLDYMRTGVIDTFQIIIFIFLIYAFTFGKKDFKNLDRFIKRKILQWKGTAQADENSDIKQEKLYGTAHAKKEAKGLGAHLLIYLVVMVIFTILFGFKSFHDFPAQEGLGDMIGYITGNGFFDHPAASRISGVWTLVLVVDAIYSLSFFIFPKRAPGK